MYNNIDVLAEEKGAMVDPHLTHLSDNNYEKLTSLHYDGLQ